MFRLNRWKFGVSLVLLLVVGAALAPKAHAQTINSRDPGPKSGLVSVQGQIPSEPPKVGATIAIPTNGQSFSTLPITVSGSCPTDLLVEIFKNNVFSGSVDCVNGSYKLQIDLFVGQNDLVAKVVDALNQFGPDSNTVTVSFNGGAQPGAGQRISLTTNFAKRGADPGQDLTWPIIINGGIGPYAVSVDWGDKTAADLISQSLAGSLTLKHVFTQPGVYHVTVKGTDAKGEVAFLQVVGIANGQAAAGSTGSGQNSGSVTVKKVIIWWPAVMALVVATVGFYLGMRHEVELIKLRLQKGQRPFK
jgi:hypothetical protein